MTPVRLEPAALRSRVKHSTTEPLRSLMMGNGFVSIGLKNLYKIMGNGFVSIGLKNLYKVMGNGFLSICRTSIKSWEMVL